MLKRRGPSRSPLRHPRSSTVAEDRKHTLLGPCSPGSSLSVRVIWRIFAFWRALCSRLCQSVELLASNDSRVYSLFRWRVHLCTLH